LSLKAQIHHYHHPKNKPNKNAKNATQTKNPKKKRETMKRTTSPSMTKVFEEESDLQNTRPGTSKFANLRKKNRTKKSERKERERKRGKRDC
jgi:hypothetical protein